MKYKVIAGEGEGDSCSRYIWDGNELIFDPADDGWTSNIKGTLAVSIKDSGSDFTIKIKGKPAIKLDVCRAAELLYALKMFYVTSDKIFQKATYKPDVESGDI